ncbi:MAG: hypothetical protein QME68_08650 [Elusimicrobiota bacterium]|nr:hypothetical protein [Elusimicrobiota bacterium]
MTVPIKTQIVGLHYHIFNHKEKLAAAEFQYQPHGWKSSHRFVAIHYTLPKEPETPQITLPILGDRY